MDDFYESDESVDEEGLNFKNDDELNEYHKKLARECEMYEQAVMDLKMERDERDNQIKELQTEIERAQMQISHYNHEMHRTIQIDQNVEEANDQQKNKMKVEKEQEAARLDAQVAKLLSKYINRTLYQKKIEFDEKLEKKRSNFEAYKDDPTHEEHGEYNARSYSYQVFGLSNNLRFGELFQIAIRHWNIPNPYDYVLTDQDHHDMKLLDRTYVTQFLSSESQPRVVFVLRPRNVGMKELLISQKVGVIDSTDVDVTTKLKNEYSKIFDTIRKAKPGINTYQPFVDDNKDRAERVDGTCLNLLGFGVIFILIILSLTESSIQPYEQSIFDNFNTNYAVPTMFASRDDFYLQFPDFIYDVDAGDQATAYHIVPIGSIRIIMNRMKKHTSATVGGYSFDIYDNGFTAANTDKAPLANTTEGPWKYYTAVAETDKINIQGKFSLFDGSGYIADVAINQTRSQVVDYLTDVLRADADGSYIADAGRAYIIYSKFFEPNRFIILERTTLFELTASGVVLVTDRRNSFKPLAFKDQRDQRSSSIDLALLIITILAYVFNIIAHIIRTRSVKEIILVRTLFKYTVIGLIIAYYVAGHHKLTLSADEVINSTKFYALQQYGEARQAAVICLTCALFIHSLVMIKSFVISKTISDFLSIFSKSYKDFISFLGIFLLFLIGITFAWWIIFSSFVESFQDLFSTTFQIFMFFATGDLLVVDSLFKIDMGWAAVLLLFTTYIVFIQLDSLMMSLVQENVRNMYLKKSGPEDEPAFKVAIKRFANRVSGLTNRAAACVFRSRRQPQPQAKK